MMAYDIRINVTQKINKEKLKREIYKEEKKFLRLVL